MDFSTFTFESGTEEALDFLRKCLPSVPQSVDATNIMDYLRTGIVLCKFAPPHPPPLSKAHRQSMHRDI